MVTCYQTCIRVFYILRIFSLPANFNIGSPEGDPDRPSIGPKDFSLRYLKEQRRRIVNRKKEWQLVAQNRKKFYKQLNSLLPIPGSPDSAISCKFLANRFKMSPDGYLNTLTVSFFSTLSPLKCVMARVQQQNRKLWSLATVALFQKL